MSTDDDTVAETGAAEKAESAGVDAGTPDHAWPLGLSKQTWHAYQDDCLPGGPAAFGERYHARRWDPRLRRESSFLYRPHERDRGLFDARALTAHLQGRQIVAIPWLPMVDRFELDLDRKYLETMGWDDGESSAVGRLMAANRALGFFPSASFVSTSAGGASIVNYGPWETPREAWIGHGKTGCTRTHCSSVSSPSPC